MIKIKSAIWVFFLILGLSACSEGNKEKGDEHFKAGRYKEAIESYSEKLSTSPTNVNSLYGRARAHEELNNYEAALDDFETALKYDDRNVKVLMSMGDVLYKQKKFDMALYYYQQATGFDKDNPLAIFKEGRAQHKLGNVEEAMSRYDTAIKKKKDLGDAYLFRGALKVSSNKTKSACKDFREAQKLKVEGAEEAVKKYCQ